MSEAIGEVSKADAAVVEYFDGVMADAIRNISEETWLMNESELQAKFVQKDIDFLIRERLTKLLEEVSKAPRKIAHTEVYRGICTLQNFYATTLKNEYRLVWLLRPLIAEEKIKAGFYAAIEKTMEILRLPVDAKTAPSILKALDYFSNRHIGPVVQRIEQKSMNMNVTRNVSEEMANLDPESMLQKYSEAKAKIVSTSKLIEASVDDKEES